MTAEVVVLNKLGIALAADSAVTVTRGNETKVYNTVSKLFALSKFHPVGIMIFGNAEFMGVPWELIVKVYRAKLGRSQLPTIDAYMDDFMSFLRTSGDLFPAEAKKRYLHELFVTAFMTIVSSLDEMVSGVIEAEGKVTEETVKRLFVRCCKELETRLKAEPEVPGLGAQKARDLLKDHDDVLQEALRGILERMPLTAQDRSRLRRIAVLAMRKAPTFEASSGIVIAGYGSDEVFPNLVSFHLFGTVGDAIRCREHMRTKVGFDESEAGIIPFAQHEMVATFMEGIDPGLRSGIDQFLGAIVETLPDLVLDEVKIPISDADKAELVSQFKTKAQALLDDFRGRFNEAIETAFIEPIVGIVGALPKDELAAMAEALVNLTSFKRRVSPETETVGGPIDVAVITKGDGFVWIRRKHYFSRDLNPHFFSNYFMEWEEEEK